MALDATIRARCDSELKKSAEEIFQKLGITTSQAINIFLAKVRNEQGIPFELKIPNKATAQAIRDARNNKNMTATSLEDLKKKSLMMGRH